MASPAARRRAHHPADLNLIADAINAGDLDAHDVDATVVVRPWLTQAALRGRVHGLW